MKIIKSILLVIVCLVALALVTALFVKKDYSVMREVTINKPRQEIYDYIKLLKNQDNYSVWSKKDPNTKKTYTGTDGTIGFIATWDSEVKDVGAGEQEITKMKDGESLNMQLRFKKPFEATDWAYMVTSSINDNETKVKWGFNGTMPYPMNLMLLTMNMDEMLGKDLEQGLLNLKEILEK